MSELPILKQTGRAGSMEISLKDDSVKDVMAEYFNHPVWKMKWGDPVPDMPLDVQLELINKCNLACVACPILRQNRDKSTLSWAVLKKIIDESAREGVCYFTICGIGEATLHPDLFRLLRYIRRKKVKPKGMRSMQMMPSILISNAIWTNQQVQDCVDNPPDVLSLSLAGLTDEEIIERRQPIDLDRFYKNVKHIYNNRKVIGEEDGGISPIIHISTHIYPHEMEDRKVDIKRFKEKWFQICDAIVIKPTMVDQHHRQFEKFLDTSLKSNNMAYTNISESHYERTAPCMEVSRRLSVDSDGNIWCGHHNSEDFGSHLGNVYELSLKEIWHSKKMNNFRKEVRAGIFNRPGCKTCGGEIRDWHRNAPKIIEEKIKFGGWS